MNANLSRTTIALTLAMLLAGCAGTPVNLGPHPYAPPLAGQARDLEAKACGFQLLLLIPIAINSRQERAYRQVLAQAGGDYVTDVQWKDEWFYGLVGTSYCTTLRAKAIRAAPLPPALPAAPESPPVQPATPPVPSTT